MEECKICGEARLEAKRSLNEGCDERCDPLCYACHNTIHLWGDVDSFVDNAQRLVEYAEKHGIISKQDKLA